MPVPPFLFLALPMFHRVFSPSCLYSTISGFHHVYVPPGLDMFHDVYVPRCLFPLCLYSIVPICFHNVYEPPYLYSTMFMVHRFCIPPCTYSTLFMPHCGYVPPHLCSTVHLVHRVYNYFTMSMLHHLWNHVSEGACFPLSLSASCFYHEKKMKRKKEGKKERITNKEHIFSSFPPLRLLMF